MSNYDEVEMLLVPPNSPEFNPIENLFALIKKSLLDMVIENASQVAFEVITRMFEVTSKQIDGCFKRTFKNILSFYLNLNREKVLALIDSLNV